MLGEVEQRAGQPVDLVDDDDVDLPGRDVGEQRACSAGPLHRAARDAAIVVALAEQRPAFVRLARDVRRAGLALRIEAVELLLQPFLARLAGVDRAAQAWSWHRPEEFGSRPLGAGDVPRDHR